MIDSEDPLDVTEIISLIRSDEFKESSCNNGEACACGFFCLPIPGGLSTTCLQ